MLNHLLLYRMLLFNAVGFFGLYVAYDLGYIHDVIEADASYIVYAIAALFTMVWASTCIQAVKVSRYINQMKLSTWVDRPDLEVGAKRLWKIAHIDRAAGWMTTLGLIGTVVGFIMAFQNISIELVGDASGVQALATQLVSGMGTALVTTLVGAVAGLWTEVNYKMIVTAARVVMEE